MTGRRRVGGIAPDSAARPAARIAIAVLVCAAAIAGCRAESSTPTSGGNLAYEPGRGGDLAAELAAAFDAKSPNLLLAIDRSLAWFDRPSSRLFFPFDDPPVTHDRALASLVEFRKLLVRSTDAESFARAVLRDFDVHAAPGRDGDGEVLFTAYYAPEYPASRRPSERFAHPLYRLPDELASSAAQASTEPWRTRREIEDGKLLEGRELVWLDDALSAYLVQVNGSARLRLDDGRVMHIGYSGTNRRPYTSLGRLMIAEGLVTPEAMSMAAIREVHRRDPGKTASLMRENDRFVFFREDESAAWPLASIGVPLTPWCAIATDQSVFPPGGVALVTTTIAREGGTRPFVRFVLDQDTGGAIKGPGRADLYLGVGEKVGAIAGRQKATGRLVFLFLKPQR